MYNAIQTINLNINEFLMINLENYLEEEWKTESLDSVLFNIGYNKNEQNQYKEIFKKHFLDISILVNIPINNIEKHDQYKGDSLDELKNNTSYMNKDIDYILSNLDNLPPPFFLLKDNKLQILGGRTRTSISRVIGKESIEAFVIDYEKMLPYFSKIREHEILKYGFDIFGIEDNHSLNAALLSAARDIRDEIEPNIVRIKSKLTILDVTDENIKKIINELSLYLYGNTKQASNLNISLDEAKNLVEEHNNSSLILKN